MNKKLKNGDIGLFSFIFIIILMITIADGNEVFIWKILQEK